jgi:hypothetical protein
MMDQLKRYFRPEQLREMSLIALIVFIFLFLVLRSKVTSAHAFSIASPVMWQLSLW